MCVQVSLRLFELTKNHPLFVSLYAPCVAATVTVRVQVSLRLFELTNSLKNAFVPHKDNTRLTANSVLGAVYMLGVAGIAFALQAGVKSLVSELCSVYRALVPVHCAALTAPFTVHCSLFTVHCSLFAVHWSLISCHLSPCGMSRAWIACDVFVVRNHFF